MDPNVGRQNALFMRLPQGTRESLLPSTRLIEPAVRDMLAGPDSPSRTVYFPLSGMASMITRDPSGAATEVATIGREGMIGAEGVFDEATRIEVMWQLPGSALAIGRDVFREAAGSDPAVSAILGRFLVTVLAQTAQNAGCNRLHDLDQRAAKWLLLVHDRVGGGTFPLTQEFLAVMLGVTRPKLSLVERTLQRAGLMDRHRGNVTLLDRAELEEQACECYAVIRDLTAGLMAPD